MTRPAAEIGVIAAVAILLTLAIAAPVLRAPSERIFGNPVVGRHHDPFTTMQQFDRPIAFGVYSQPLTDVPGALLARAWGPVSAYNALVLLTFPLSAAAAYSLARHLKLARAGAAVAGIAFAFSPFHLAHAAYHPHIAQTHWLPLYFLALWRCLDQPTPAAVGFLALSTVGVTLSNFYGGLIAGVVTPVALGAYWYLTSRRQPGSAPRLAVTAATLLAMAAGGFAYAWFAAQAVVVDPAPFAFTRNDVFRYSAMSWSYLVPPLGNPALGGIAAGIWDAAGVHPGRLEQQVSVGWSVIALALVAVYAWVHVGRRETSLAVVPVLAIVAATAFVCSLSPELSIGSFTIARPAAFLYEWLPVFRAYARFGVVVQLMAVLLAGIGAERLWRLADRRARIACVVLLAVAACEYAVWPPALWRDVLPTSAHRWVARLPRPVRVLECAPLTPESESVQWLTGFRISLGRGSLGDCTEPNLSDKLSAAGYTHMLVRNDSPTGRWLASRPTPEGLHHAARFHDGEVLTVTARPPLVYTLQMTAFDSREFDETWTWRWMGAEASWTVVNRGDRPVIAAVDVEMTAFHRSRGLALLLDGREVQGLSVGHGRGVVRIGPLALAPGHHELTFRPVEPPTVADHLAGNGDRRALSFAVGAWRWVVEGNGR